MPNRSAHWSSQDIAEVLFGHEIDLSKFTPHTPSYRLSSIIDPKKAEQTPVVSQEDDSMDVDDEYTASPDEILLPSHALDLLHMQVVEHFTRLLVELVGRIRDQGGRGTSSSRHAPKDFQGWGAAECLGYLHKQKPPPRSSSPRVEVFLALPYSRGARRGQDWSRKDWEIALEALAKTGDMWQDGYIRESIVSLKPIINDVFCTRMRPTGV